MKNINLKKNKNGGFTLLELLIVIAIIAILSVALVIVLNPAETLKKARDAQRISDLSTIKTAMGLYMTSVANPILGGASNDMCKETASGAWASGDKIAYSLPSGTPITAPTFDGSSEVDALQVSNPSLTDGTGWIPVDFSDITGGSPISNLPVDPVNKITSLSAVASSDLVYRYGCSVSPLAYEINAQLESAAYTVDDNKRTSDGGNNTSLYETGTNLLILGAGTDF